MKKVKNQPNCFEHVYAIIQTIPRGKVLTYGIISLMMNRRISAAAVGWALNGLPNNKGSKYSMDTVPWYRVINSKGKVSTKLNASVLDDKGQPIKLQRILLENEGVKFDSNGVVDLTQYLFIAGSKT
jgi:methylated-DNA-protein-cysteine methyltransferase related protein